jgi:monoterpene epsilon-lactone hydrolase
MTYSQSEAINYVLTHGFAAVCFLAAFAGPTAFAGASVNFGRDGSAHIVDLTVPIPTTISPEAQAMLAAAGVAAQPSGELTPPLAEVRSVYAEKLTRLNAELFRMYPVTVEHKTLGGVPVNLVTPTNARADLKDRLLINLHGGAFVLGHGAISEAIPIAAKTGIAVLAIDYRLAPEAPFPAAVDDTIAVYRELLKSYKSQHLAFYGSSAGAILAAQASVRARQLGLPLPAALGFFSGTVDFARPGDSEAFFSIEGLAPLVTPVAVQAQAYLGSHSRIDPVLSPVYADTKGFPPVLLMCGSRDFFLSGTSNFHRQLLRAGVPAELVVFDGMPHVHWEHPNLPESKEALDIQARFLAEKVGGP